MLISAVDTDSTSYAMGQWVFRLGLIGLGVGLILHAIRLRKSPDNRRGDGFIAGGAIAIILGLVSTAVGVSGADDHRGTPRHHRQQGLLLR